MTRTGMSVKEARLELKVRGVKDPARNPTYRNVVIDKAPQSPSTSLENQNKEKPKPHINDKIEAELEKNV